jgi:hypothetical protein
MGKELAVCGKHCSKEIDKTSPTSEPVPYPVKFCIPLKNISVRQALTFFPSFLTDF